MSSALSATVAQRTVVPSRLHQMSGWEAVTVKAGCCTERTHGEPSRLVVLDLRNCAGSGSPADVCDRSEMFVPPRAAYSKLHGGLVCARARPRLPTARG